MEFTNEMIEKAREAKSALELLAMAKEAGVELSEADANKYYDFLHYEGELSDDEITQVAGGKGGKPDPAPKYQPGQRVSVYFESSRSTIHGTIEFRKSYRYEGTLIYQYRVFIEEYGYAITLELEHLTVQVIG